MSLFLCLSSLVLKGCVFYACFLEEDEDIDDDDCAFYRSSVSLFISLLPSLVFQGCVFYVCFLEEDVVVLFRRSVLLETTYGFGGIEIFRVFFNARYYARFIPTFR